MASPDAPLPPPPTAPAAAPRRALLGLVNRRERWGLSARGWLALLALTVVGLTLARFHLQAFLTQTRRVDAQHLVVEGWMPDYAFDQAVEEFRRGTYRRVFCTGGPIDHGSLLTEFKSYAEVAARTLQIKGLPAEAIVAVPMPARRRGRTWGSAIALRDYLRSSQERVQAVNVLSLGAHARRTRILFAKALGRDLQVGVLAVLPRDYEPDHWWRSSYGLKDVLGETVAYLGAVADY